MIEVKCNGKIYRFSENSEIIDRLDMQALETADDPGFDAAPPAGKAYTRDAAVLILDRFESLLTEKDIHVPCSDPDEQAELDGDPDNDARLYGTEYSGLLDAAEAEIIALAEKVRAGAELVTDEFSGTV